MARYVKFPGTAGSYASTDDVNLLDADTAHMSQANIWNGSRMDLVWTPVATDGWGEIEGTVNDIVGSPRFQSLGQQPLDITGDFILSAEVRNASDHTVNFQTRVLDGGANPFGASHPVLAGESLRISDTLSMTSTVTQIWVQANVGAQVGDVYYLSKVNIASAVTTFVPSLRIVGTLFEAFDSTPDDPPIAFAADGTPLTVGVSWAGNLFSYSRHDGADATAPIVAIFDADDVPSI